MGSIIKNSQSTEDDINPSQVAIDDKAIRALADTWKGTTVAGAELVIAEVKRFEARYKSYSHIRLVAGHLMALIDDFPPNGEHLTREWEKEHHPSYDSDPISLVVRFLKELWPQIYPFATPRPDPRVEVNDRVKIRINAIISKSTCAADFWDVYTKADRKETQPVARPGASAKKSRVADEFIFKLRAFLANNPGICPNCFGAHKISECDKLEADSRNNLAAYYWQSYEQDTGKTRRRFQNRYSSWLNHHMPK